MRLAEELVLLLLNEESGYLEQVRGWNLSCVLAGAVLADLAFERRIDTDLESLSLIDPTPTGDALLDPVLAEIAADATTHNAQYWIEKTAVRSDDVLDEVLERLVANKILRHDLGGFWSLTRHVASSGSYPAADGTARAEVKGRIHRTIVEDLLPHPRDIVIIGLMNACDGFRFLLDPEEYEAAEERIGLLSNMDLLGQALAAAVAESSARLATMAAAYSKPIPKVNLLMLLGHRSLWRGNVARLMADLYEKYGPVFEFKAPFAKRGMPVLAGPAANTWMNRKGRDYLRTKECLADWERVYGAARTLPGMDGADHYRLRKAQHPTHTRAAIADRLDELYEQARASLQQWRVGGRARRRHHLPGDHGQPGLAARRGRRHLRPHPRPGLLQGAIAGDPRAALAAEIHALHARNEKEAQEGVRAAGEDQGRTHPRAAQGQAARLHRRHAQPACQRPSVPPRNRQRLRVRRPADRQHLPRQRARLRPLRDDLAPPGCTRGSRPKRTRCSAAGIRTRTSSPCRLST